MQTPERIDRYEILRKLATGGMAELFLAKQTGMEGFEKVVVLKRILAHLAHDQEFVSMFLDEARIAAMLSHANIVQIYDLGRADETFYIAMEYVSGRNMAAVMRKARETGLGIPIEHTCRIVTGVADGLYYAHTRKDFDGRPLNIIHRDISPQNILISFQGGVKLVDFGIAKASTQLAQTRAGVLKGKYAYMSPEQVRGDKIDHRSDVFAVGVVMYEFLTGQRPFERETSLKTLKAIVQEKPLNPREINPEVPIDVVRILSRALEKNPDRRYPNAQELQLALEDYLDRAPRKSNNVRLSRWLYELFDDELNADGGTMIVKGIGEIIVPTGQSSEEAEKPKIEEIPEGTVRAALDEIQARHDNPGNAISLVTDETLNKPNFDQATTDSMSAAVSTDPDARSEEPDENVDDELTGPGVADEDYIPDTVLQMPPEPPPQRPAAGKGNGKHREPSKPESPQQTEPSEPLERPTGIAADQAEAPAANDRAPGEQKADHDAVATVATSDGEDDAGDFGDDQPPTIELDRAALLRGDLSLPMPPSAAGQRPAAGAAEIADGGDGEDQDLDDELDGATIPAYDPAQFLGKSIDGKEIGGASRGGDVGPPVQAAAEDSKPASLQSLPELPHVEEAETASLSPAEVRRILDRVELLRQQAASSETGQGQALSEEAGAATAAGLSEAEVVADADIEPIDEPNYSGNILDATIAQAGPEASEKGGNGAGSESSDFDSESCLTQPGEAMGFETTEPGEYEDGSDAQPHPGRGKPQAAAPSAPGDPVAAGGIRITRRRATDAEIRERAKSELSGHQLNAVPAAAAAAPSLVLTPKPKSDPGLSPMPADDEADLAPPAARAPLATPSGTSSEPSLVEEISHPIAARSTHSAANARLLLVLMILLAVAAGLVVLYVVLFANQPSGPVVAGGAENGL
ncbi:MAG: serine/threonine protein kinase, partial [Deltaproteobacteria bacterium]|nr:serine/threonine protein kinase [Deltaproteobacteria bacterium]